MDALYEVLAPYFENADSRSLNRHPPPSNNSQAARYLTRLSTLSLSELTANEQASLSQSAQSHLRNLQALSKRSHKAVISSTASLTSLSALLPSLHAQATTLQSELPNLEGAAAEFAKKYDRSAENEVLDRRKKLSLLSRNVDRVTDVLDLPTLLSSTVASAQSSSFTSSSNAATAYATALDLHAHIRRLNALYPQSSLVGDISKQAEAEIQNLTAILITSLQTPSLKLAGAMRTIGWLRRVAPDLTDSGPNFVPNPQKRPQVAVNSASTDGALGSLFLVCRLHTLHTTLEALEPLRELADQESARRKQGISSKSLKQQISAGALGSQSERYLKRYVEIFREQSFNIISMYKSIFPAGLPNPEGGATDGDTKRDTFAGPTLPSPLSSFALHLVEMLTGTLREYLPNISDKHARESLMTQVLYCAGSLGRLGADFGMMIALLEEDVKSELTGSDNADSANEDLEWVEVMKKHRIQASRLEVLARGVGSSKKSSITDRDANAVLSPS